MTNALDSVLSDYENLIIGGEPLLDRERQRDMKRLRESVEIMRMVCQRLINTEQPTSRALCSYCRTKGHRPFCVVAAAKAGLKKLGT